MLVAVENVEICGPVAQANRQSRETHDPLLGCSTTPFFCKQLLAVWHSGSTPLTGPCQPKTLLRSFGRQKHSYNKLLMKDEFKHHIIQHMFNPQDESNRPDIHIHVRNAESQSQGTRQPAPSRLRCSGTVSGGLAPNRWLKLEGFRGLKQLPPARSRRSPLCTHISGRS